MSKETINTKKPLNPDDLYDLIANARSSFKSYKLSASSAAANAYLLWRDTMAFGAPREGKDWMMGEIAKRNEEIKKHNEDLKKRENTRKTI